MAFHLYNVQKQAKPSVLVAARMVAPVVRCGEGRLVTTRGHERAFWEGRPDTVVL